LNNLLIIGAGGHGKVIVEIATEMKKWNKISFLDDNYSSSDSQHNGYPILGKIDSYKEFQNDYKDLFIAIGENKLRCDFFYKFSNIGFNIPNIIHPSAIISNTVRSSSGIVIMANAVVNSSSIIEDASIINTSASIDHDCILHEGVHICPGVNLAGNVNVGRLSWLGIGSSVIEGINIGEEVTVGAGAVIIKNIPDKKIVVGNPAESTN